MPTKDSILENVAQYTANELTEYVRKGIVTFDELCNDTYGEFSPGVRREVERQLEGGDSEEWEKAKREGTVEAVERYLNMYPEGSYRSEARALKATLAQRNATRVAFDSADAIWNSVDKTNIESLNNFVNQNPDNPHVPEANRLINDLMLCHIMDISAETLVAKIKEYETSKVLTPEQKDNRIIDEINNYISKKKITKADFLRKLREDHNLLSAGIVKRLLDSGIISSYDLLSIEIKREFIQRMLQGVPPDDFNSIRALDKIHKQSTEIYFWGIPASGKSCALGAILSVAKGGTVAKVMDADTDSQGYGYMNYLINHFPQKGVCTLIGGTPINAFYEMGFDLVDKNNKIHPITFIDMAGELMRCMYKSNAGMDLKDTEVEMLDTLTKVLIDNRSTNRKMHIFVIEYGAEDRTYEGYPQIVYLEGAVSYIKNTGIFKKETDAIYIMITKADKMQNPTKDALDKYITDNYLGFYNGLERICRDNEINGKKVEKIAFSLGDVCFKNYCQFNTKPAENVVNLILDRSASYNGGRRGLIERFLSN